MKQVDIRELKNEYNFIIAGYLDSKEATLKSYIDNLPYETRMRLYKIEEVLQKAKKS